MGLHDRLKTSNGASAATSEALLSGSPVQEAAPDSKAQDPYAELKTRIHHACIATLGAELFKREATGDLNERVTRAVTEQLVLDRTPLTREERRQIIREITDDILGYGPLEPFLRDDSVTEVMVNAYDRIYVERLGKIERTPAAFADNSHLLRIIDKIVSQVGRRVDEASPMVDARLPDGSRVNAILPRARPERSAHAPRPDHRRRGPRTRDPGHAPGDEHGPRRLADDDPRELASRRAFSPRDAGADRGRRAAAARDPRAGVKRVRRTRADHASRRRLA